MAEITVGSWPSRLPIETKERFRTAVRMALKEFNAPERRAARLDLAFRLIADSLVERADRMGVRLEPEAELEVYEKEFDFGNALGIAGGATGTFTATPRQFIHWLTWELERERAARRALERGWGYRAWRMAQGFCGWLLWPVRALRPPLDDCR